METRYTVRQAVEMTGVKSYVLRYWEEELELRIHRNELGHRYYTGYDIQLFMNIKELKKRGLQLRAIRELIPKLARTAPGSTESRTKLLEGEMVEIPPDKEEVVTEEIIEDPHKDNDEKILEFQTILERLIAQELKLQNESEDEERCRSLDLAIRRQQMARKEAAELLKKDKKRSCSIIATASLNSVCMKLIQLGE